LFPFFSDLGDSLLLVLRGEERWNLPCFFSFFLSDFERGDPVRKSVSPWPCFFLEDEDGVSEEEECFSFL